MNDKELVKSIFKNTTRAKIGSRWFVPIEEIEQAIQSLLKQAELRGRIDELKLAYNEPDFGDEVNLLTHYFKKRLAELESQMEKEG